MTRVCKKCGGTKPIDAFVTSRGVATYACKSCAAAYRKKWALAHPEKLKEYEKRNREVNKAARYACSRAWALRDPDYKKKAAEYRQKNAAKLRDYAREYREANSEQMRGYKERHYIANRADYIQRAYARIAHVARATPKWADLSAIRAVFQQCPDGFHVDHIIPLRGELVSGLHVANNLQHLPAHENLSKSNNYEVV